MVTGCRRFMEPLWESFWHGFMKNMQDAEKLAEEMVKIGSLAGRNTIAVISDMDEPLGLAVGNALEVAEAVKTLKKEGPEDLINLCLELGTQMLIASKVEEKFLTKMKNGVAGFVNQVSSFFTGEEVMEKEKGYEFDYEEGNMEGAEFAIHAKETI